MPPRKKSTLWAQYQDLLVRKPFTMNLVQSGVIGGAGNLAYCQTYPDRCR